LLASSIHNSPNKKRADYKENFIDQPGSVLHPKPESVKKPMKAEDAKKMRRHNSQENISAFKPHKAEPAKGILRQSSKPNIQVEPTAKKDILSLKFVLVIPTKSRSTQIRLNFQILRPLDLPLPSPVVTVLGNNRSAAWL